jgi:hypothetical protein
MQPRKMLGAALVIAAALAGTGPAGAAEEAHGYNNGDSGFINLAEVQDVATERSTTDVLSLVGHCTFDQTVVPFSNQAVVKVIGKATVSTRENARVQGVAVRCVVKDAQTGEVYLDKTDGLLPGPVTTWAHAYQEEVARLTICTQVTALLNTGTVVSQKFPCQAPSLLPA